MIDAIAYRICAWQS